MRRHEPYFDSLTNTWRVIAMDDDGFFFNVVPDAGGGGNAKDVAAALNRENN